ncbi:MAG TPA: ATP-grasp domain-containing protein [Rhodocyclaceae bacterium]|nr:ATP-grasp domain-containing protein [Rhodocyclaceae bacterium]HRQ45345.1 ATP-grasp domain-containing protein [Rhodocyclaceae bacterium]
MRFSMHFDLVGGSSIDDHGRFVYETYVPGIPLHDDPGFAGHIERIVREYRIDAIYPTMDAVAETLQNMAAALPCRVIGSPPSATRICASKSATYDLLGEVVPVPKRYASLAEAPAFPVFIKPDRGYGSRHGGAAETESDARALIGALNARMLILEYLPGREWTVDCFTDRHSRLRFHGARERHRISNGISVNTSPSAAFSEELAAWADAINRIVKPRGAWFFQAREAASGQPKLLEVAARLGGSSGLFRCRGVNFALLSAFDAFDQDIQIAPNTYSIELDRALGNRYKIGVSYSRVFVDLDDCLLIGDRINHQLVGFLYKAFSEGKRLILLTRHTSHPPETLNRIRLAGLFDDIVHITDGSPKSDHIEGNDAIFIDDSFHERAEVARQHGIPVFAPDMVEALL